MLAKETIHALPLAKFDKMAEISAGDLGEITNKFWLAVACPNKALLKVDVTLLLYALKVCCVGAAGAGSAEMVALGAGSVDGFTLVSPYNMYSAAKRLSVGVLSATGVGCSMTGSLATSVSSVVASSSIVVGSGSFFLFFDS